MLADSASLRVFFHSNRDLKRSGAPDGLHVTQGWWNGSRLAQQSREVRRQLALVDCALQNLSAHTCARRQRRRQQAAKTLAATEKYAWLVDRLGGGGREERATDDRRPVLMVDTDVVFQCSAAEISERFSRLNASLVIGAETKLWPLNEPHELDDPWPRPASGTHLRYPNSGMIMGTPRAFSRLESLLRRLRGFPCCRPLPRDRRCILGDQGCLQACRYRNLCTSCSAALIAPPWPVPASPARAPCTPRQRC